MSTHVEPYKGDPTDWYLQAAGADGVFCKRVIAPKAGPDGTLGEPDTSVQIALVSHVDDTGNVAYSQVIRAEKGGGMMLLVDTQGRIGLTKMMRPMTRDQNAWAAAWPNMRLDTLGRPSWELSRGFATVTDKSGADTAGREAGEEVGYHVGAVIEAGDLCEVNDNTAFSPHMTTVRWARVNADWLAEPTPDANEPLLSKVTWFTLDELHLEIGMGNLVCAYTLAAITAFMVRNSHQSASQG